MDTAKALTVLKAALELHAGHMNGTVPTNTKTQQQLMDLIEEAYKALGGKIGGRMNHG